MDRPTTAAELADMASSVYQMMRIVMAGVRERLATDRFPEDVRREIRSGFALAAREYVVIGAAVDRALDLEIGPEPDPERLATLGL